MLHCKVGKITNYIIITILKETHRTLSQSVAGKIGNTDTTVSSGFDGCTGTGWSKDCMICDNSVSGVMAIDAGEG